MRLRKKKNPEVPKGAVLRAYIAYSRFIAILALGLPIALVLSRFVYGDAATRCSLSAYYHGVDGQRDLFVGILCAVAGFLVLYRGWRSREGKLLNVAGLAAVLVAFFPTDPDPDCGLWPNRPPREVVTTAEPVAQLQAPGGTAPEGRPTTSAKDDGSEFDRTSVSGVIHLVAAVVLFACIFGVGVLLPRKRKRENSENELPLLGYSLSVATMSLGVAFAAFGGLFLDESPLLLLGEVFLIVGFGVFWWIRTEHLSNEQQREWLLQPDELGDLSLTARRSGPQKAL